jgi:alkaline phosphatase D
MALWGTADLRLIVSSIQVLNEGTGFEAWRHLPTERDHFYNMILGKRAILLTGDRPFGAFYESRGLVEVTASSFTHTIPIGKFCDFETAAGCDEEDAARVGDTVRENHFGSIEIDWQAEVVTLSLQRVESSYGSVYTRTRHGHGKFSDAGDVMMSKQYNFSDL